MPGWQARYGSAATYEPRIGHVRGWPRGQRLSFASLSSRILHASPDCANDSAKTAQYTLSQSYLDERHPIQLTRPVRVRSAGEVAWTCSAANHHLELHTMLHARLVLWFCHQEYCRERLHVDGCRHTRVCCMSRAMHAPLPQYYLGSWPLS